MEENITSSPIRKRVQKVPPEPLPSPAEDRQSASVQPAQHPLHNTAVHTACIPSLLTSSSEEQNFRGFFNLCAIILVVSHFRIVIENFLKYGLLISPSTLRMYVATDYLLIGLVDLQIHALIALYIEKFAVNNKKNEQMVHIANFINVTSSVLLPCIFVYYSHVGPVVGITLLSQSFVLFMKLVSYVLVNRDFRHQYWKGQAVPEAIDEDCRAEHMVTYPNNLTLSNFYYFLAAPVLVYQMNYPRTKEIRWYWLMGKCGQFLFCVALMLFTIEQFIMPAIKNSMGYMLNTNVPFLIVRLLKLSIPSLVIWLLMFYAFFHLYLNIVSELLMFGDRRFYLDWWNSTTIAEYWRKWNLPVHYWLVRHVYYPMRRRNYHRYTANIFIFFTSALFHELLSSIPLSLIRFHFFWGMLFQSPLAVLTEMYTKGSQLGNFIFWIVFCIIGQPMILLLYYHDYLIVYGNPQDVATPSL